MNRLPAIACIVVSILAVAATASAQTPTPDPSGAATFAPFTPPPAPAPGAATFPPPAAPAVPAPVPAAVPAAPAAPPVYPAAVPPAVQPAPVAAPPPAAPAAPTQAPGYAPPAATAPGAVPLPQATPTTPLAAPAAAPVYAPPAAAAPAAAPAPATRPVPAAAAPAAPTTKEVVQQQNTKVNVGSNGAFFGETGLWRITSAEPIKSLGLRVNFHGEYFRYPGFLYDNDTTERQVGDLSIALVPYDNLEIFLLYQTMSTSNDKVVPPLQLSQGNITFGAKYAYPFTKYLSAGLFLGFGLNSEPGQSMYSFGCTSYTLKALGTLDTRPLGSPVPLRLHANAGAYLIRSDQFGLQEPRDRYLHYMLNINEQKQGQFGFAVDFPLDKDSILPFIEVTFGMPDGPGYVTPGVKWQPFDGHGLTLDIYVDIGLFRGTPALAPTTQIYDIIFGASYAISTTPQVKVIKERVIERVVEKEPVAVAAPAGGVRGLVVDADNETPLGNAIITMLGTGLTNLASDPVKGDFAAAQIKPGQYTFAVEKDGYEANSVKVDVKLNETVPLKVPLKKKIQEGAAAVKVVDVKGRAIEAAEVQAISGGRVVDLKKDDTGRYAGKLDAGKWYVVAKAENKLAVGKVVEVKPLETAEAEIALKDRPKSQLVIIEKDRIQLKKKIQFKSNSAQITGAESFAILDSVMDAINSNPRIKKVKIEGHTDDKGVREKNVQLSKDRANAVRDYLIKGGIGADALEAEGYGPDKPIESNKTNRGRETNRRVEFIVVE